MKAFANIWRPNINVWVVVIVFLSSLVLLVEAQFCKKDVTRPVNRWTQCMECSVNSKLRCPSPYQHSTPGEGLQVCSFIMLFGYLGAQRVQGCRHICARDEKFSVCCDGFWGKDCQACPGTPVCSGNGQCSEGLEGNGSCSCQRGFKGTACELCTDKNKFGPYCNFTCTCKNGECDSWINGTGQCKPYTCKNGYYGQDCEMAHPLCDGGNAGCHVNASCYNISGTDTCICNTGFNGTGQVCTAINPCTDGTHGCHKNSECRYTSPGRHQCVCSTGYTGDGYVCTVIDNCQSADNGGCPKNSTKCNYLSPGKSNCSCLTGYRNYTKNGCTLIDLCRDGNRGGCDVNADCVMRAPLLKSCECRRGYRGNGTVCYGNIIQRINQLNSDGPYKSKLDTSSLIFSHDLSRPFSGGGPFTVFVVTDAGIGQLTSSQQAQFLGNTDLASHIVRLHVVAGDLDSTALKTAEVVTTLQGTRATITEQNGTLYYQVAGQPNKAKIETPDLLAGNGIIHIIDRSTWHPGPYSDTRKVDLVEILETNNRFKTFSGLLINSGILSDINALSQMTVFAPDESAFTKLPKETLDYLVGTVQGKRKLQILMRNHFVSRKIDIFDLINQRKVTSIGGDSSAINVHRYGRVNVGAKAGLTETNIVGSNGIIHVMDRLLTPPELEPLLPNFCNTSYNVTSSGFCYRCDSIGGFPRRGCRAGYTPDGIRNRSCTYSLRYLGRYTFSFTGCRTNPCYRTLINPECCSGFYGSLCLFCPGPLNNPCHGNGKCADKIRGTGACSCDKGFRGTACELCRDSNKFGPFCNQTCTCVHGKCDDGPIGNGTCRPNTCSTGYHGNNCDQRDTVCPSANSLRCHVNAQCVVLGSAESCKCNEGYEGSGVECSEINRCQKPDRGGCHSDAICTKTGPGTSNCSCDFGFEGDGIFCKAIDPCVASERGGCHANADCLFTGPGRSTCKCREGYTGSGFACSELNRCLVNNGGCPQQSRCSRTGPGTRTCQCNVGYVTVSGDNQTVLACLPSIATIIDNNAELLALFNLVKKGNLMYYLADPTKNLTVFAASNGAILSFPSDETSYWTASSERTEFLIEYHMLDSIYTLSELKSMSSAVAVNGQSLNFSAPANNLVINGVAHVIVGNFSAANGILHIIDKVLLPQRPVTQNSYKLSEILRNISYFSEFVKLLEGKNLLGQLDNCDHCTVFAPTNDAMQKYKTTNNSKAVTGDILKYHVVTSYILIKNVHSGQEFTTFLGNTFKVKLTKSTNGKVQVNFNDVNPRAAKSSTSVVYGIGGVLLPVKNHCPETRRVTEYSTCHIFLCFVRGGCRSGARYEALSGCGLFSCRWRCSRTVQVSKCCKGFWGPDCQSCPGAVGNACSGYDCSDGKSGNGHCSCSDPHVTGTACEICKPGFYGKGCAQQCLCSAYGTCNDGPKGDGSCTCEHNWKGAYCNISTDHSNCPVGCHRFATCRGSPGNGTCECDAGYAGNGTTVCNVIKACSSNNGDCHKNAKCTQDSGSHHGRICSCLPGYTGDGVYCQAIDPCQTNKGGCHENATCSMVGPGRRACLCKEGFSGDGETCLGMDPCKHENGGCSFRAECKQTGPHERRCTCKGQYVGDGVTCLGDSMDAINHDPQLSKFGELVRKLKLQEYLESSTKSGLLAPTNKAIEKAFASRKRRSISPSKEQILKYHVIGCIRLSSVVLVKDVNLTSLLGPPLRMKRVNGTITINDAVVTQTYESNNGLVFKLDKALIPPVTPNPSPDQLRDLYNTSKAHGYGIVADILKIGGVLPLLNSPLVRPIVMFWPTDKAINALPADLKLRLVRPNNRAETEKYLKYHIISQTVNGFGIEKFIRGGAGVEFRTMEGSSLFVSCGGGKGDLYVNGQSKIVEREIRFKSGVAFGIDKMLIPLGNGGRCDEIRDTKTLGQCGSCFLTENCAEKSTFLGMTNHNCTYGANSNLIGCQPVCLHRVRHNKCCSNLYGPSCQPCPGGVYTPCSGRGKCDDGLSGSGKCTCTSYYAGAACEICPADAACPTPGSCSENNGGCHALAACNSTAGGAVTCTCAAGYHGDGRWCQMIDRCLQNNGGCGENATCLFTGPGTFTCQCRPAFSKVGSQCKPHPVGSPCAHNNGGCSSYATCTNTGGTASCACREGFTGDGNTCEGNLIQVIKETAKLSEFYKALYYLKITGHASLFADLQEPSKKFTLFAPINNAVSLMKLYNFTNLANHIVRGRVFFSDIKTGKSKSWVTLVESKLLIKRTSTNLVINNIAHSLGDIPGTNGLIHVVDQMIPVSGLPPPPTTPPPVSTKFTTVAPTPVKLTTNAIATTASVSTQLPQITTLNHVTHTSVTTVATSSTAELTATQTVSRTLTVTHASVTKMPVTTDVLTTETEIKKPIQTTAAETEQPSPTATSSTTAVMPGVFGKRKSEGLSGGATAGIVIAILVLIIVMVVVIVGFLWKRKRLPHPSFRYKKEDETVQYDSDAFGDPASLYSFENPMYGTHPSGESVELKSSAAEKETRELQDFSNPVYDEINAQVARPEILQVVPSRDPADVKPSDVKIPLDKPGEETCFLQFSKVR